MNILLLTKIKKSLLQKWNTSVDEYITTDHFFGGWNNGFKSLGHNTFLNWDESFFFPGKLKIKCIFLYRAFNFFLIKTKLKIIDRYLLSRKIARFCTKNKIDVIYTEINTSISPLVIKKYAPNVIITQWYGIFPEMSDQITLKLLSQYDIIWGPCEFDESKITFDGIQNLKYIGSAVNNKLYFYDYNSDYAYDVVFVGGVGKGHSKRIEILEAIAQTIESFAFYGYGEENIPKGYKLKKVYKGWVNSDEMRKLFSSSRIALNLTLDGYDRITRGFNARLFEIAACGGALQMVKADNKLSEYFTVDEDLVTFENKEELILKIKFYLAQKEKAREITKSALIKSKEFSYDEKAKVASKILDDYRLLQIFQNSK